MPRKNQYIGGIIGADPLLGVSSSIDYLVVAGGGAGGGSGGRGGGGGAGGMRTSWGTGATSGASGYSGGLQSLEAALPLSSSNSFAITVGRGGVSSGVQADGDDGNDSTFGSITAFFPGGITEIEVFLSS